MRAASCILALSLVASLVSCSAPVREYACTVEPAALDVDAFAVWSCNRDVLRRAVARKSFTLREFERAAAFFERLTGIRPDTRPSHLGPLPGPELKRDLAELDAWYESNRGSLRWDARQGEVVSERLAPSGGPV